VLSILSPFTQTMVVFMLARRKATDARTTLQNLWSARATVVRVGTTKVVRSHRNSSSSSSSLEQREQRGRERHQVITVELISDTM